MPFSITRTNRQAECDIHMMKQAWSWLTIKSLQAELEHNEGLIHLKTELHGNTLPIPFRECRQNLRAQIGSLVERNIEIKAELKQARATRDLAETGIEKCVLEKILNAVPPVQGNFSTFARNENKV